MHVPISPITAAILLSLVSAGAAFETVATMSGIGKVKDGDGILFGKVEIRLQGIAAPEDNSAKLEVGGKESTENLRGLVDGRFVVCHLDGTTAAKRPVGICFVDGIEVNRYQVQTGHARDCRKFSRGRYLDDELAARRAGHELHLVYDLPSYC